MNDLKTFHGHVNSMYLGICESEALTIQGHPHHQLGLGAPRLVPVVHCEVLGKFIFVRIQVIKAFCNFLNGFLENTW